MLRNKSAYLPIPIISRAPCYPSCGSLSFRRVGLPSSPLVPPWVGGGSPNSVCILFLGPKAALLPCRVSHSHSQTEHPRLLTCTSLKGTQNQSTGLAGGQPLHPSHFLVYFFLRAPTNTFLFCQHKPKALLQINSCKQAPAGVTSLPDL